MDFFKKQGAGFYASCAAAVLSVVALILYFSNISNPYFADIVSPGIVATSVIALVATVAAILLPQLSGGNKAVGVICDLLPVAASFCLFAACMMFLNLRVYNMAIIYGSSLESSNAAAHSAMAQAVAAIIVYFAAGIAVVCSAFLKRQKADEI